MSESPFRALAEDLLTLEINTIVKANMSARKMPALRREALLDIAKRYHLKLVELDVRGSVVWSSAGIMAFLELRKAAYQGKAVYEQKLKDSPAGIDHDKIKRDLVMLMRIEGQSEQLISMLIKLAHDHEDDFELARYSQAMQAAIDTEAKSNPSAQQNPAWNNDLSRQTMQQVDDLVLSPAQVSLIRKVWEIGTEQVVLQTVIHADGDVTTRIAEHLVKQPSPILFKVHNESVQNSVEFWHRLVNLVTDMTKSLFK